MADLNNGLRFDVYERVHLPVNVADIHELEEIELTPRIGVFHQGGQVVLRGNLLLSGVYVSQSEDKESRTLEHWIPVEISLPMNRVDQLGDISVEIENFDVALLSARTLNITGVLSLRGVEVKQLETPGAWQEETITAVNSRNILGEEAPDSQPLAAFSGDAPSEWTGEKLEQAEPITEEQSADNTNSYVFEEEDSSSREEALAWQEYYQSIRNNPDNTPEADPIQQEAQQPDVPELGDQDRPIDASSSWSDTLAEGDLTVQADEESAFELYTGSGLEEAEQQEPEAEPAKSEMKIAMGVKRPEEDSVPNKSGLLTLLHGSRRDAEAQKAAEIALQEAEQVNQAPPGEEVQWKTLFLGGRGEERDFRRVRLCIVQREETLEAIAGRYQLNPREILLYNRMDEGSITEGQVIYIP
jgi:stage VI sporulation protein D